MRRDQGDENQSVLGPLMHTQHLRDRPEPRWPARHDLDVRKSPLHCADQPWACARNDLSARALPYVAINVIVAYIVETALAESLDESLCLVATGEIRHAIGGEDAVEHAHVLRDASSERFILSRGEVDPTSARFGLMDDLQHRFIVRQPRRVERRSLRQHLLEGGAISQAVQDLDEGPRPTRDRIQRRFLQQVRPDERSVQVDHQRRLGCRCNRRQGFSEQRLKRLIHGYCLSARATRRSLAAHGRTRAPSCAPLRMREHARPGRRDAPELLRRPRPTLKGR